MEFEEMRHAFLSLKTFPSLFNLSHPVALNGDIIINNKLFYTHVKRPCK